MIRKQLIVVARPTIVQCIDDKILYLQKCQKKTNENVNVQTCPPFHFTRYTRSVHDWEHRRSVIYLAEVQTKRAYGVVFV